jgi:acetylornithine deacetylase/succinyl-diaminopimelate desuccinylase-like protein
VEFKGKSLSSESSTDTPLYRALETGFKKNDPRAKVVPYMSPGATDSRFFREKGIPAYGVQVESSNESTERIHGHNERISAKQLTMGIKVLYDTIREFCI